MSIEVAHDEKMVRCVNVKRGEVGELGLQGRVDGEIRVARGRGAVEIDYIKDLVAS